MKVLFVVNEAGYFLSHRLPLAQQALARGAHVMVATAPDTGEDELAQYGIEHRAIPLSRSGFRLWSEVQTYRALLGLYREVRPDLVHHVTIKPVLYGTFAARSSRITAVVNAIPGMGYIFTRHGARASIVRSGVNALYRLALRHKNMRVIFQNKEDMAGFVGHAIVPRQQAVLIRGAGVDLEKFAKTAEPTGPPVFLLASRMLKDKGIVEFAHAAGRVRSQHPDWRFLMAGRVDAGNPASLTEAQLHQLERDYRVEWLGQRNDMHTLLADVHVFVMPSYREGLPKVLLEAAAAGRASIASDIAGCREVVTNEVTGLIVAARDAVSLGDAMLRLGRDAQLRLRLGDAAFEKAAAVFSEADVVNHTFRVYEALLPSGRVGA